MSSSKSGVSAETLGSISTPDKVESRLGTLEFDDGAPSEATAALLYDHLDFHPRGAGVSRCVAWRFARRGTARLPVGRGGGQLLHVVLRADGFGVACS